MAKKKGRVSLLGGLIGEGLEIGVDVFLRATKDEQKAAVQKFAGSLKGMITDIQTKTHSIRNKTLRERVQEVLNEISREIDSIMKEFSEDPVEAAFRLLFLPIWLLFELSSIIWGEFFDFLRGLFEPEKPVTYQEAIRNAERFLTLAGDFNVLATIFNLIGDFKIMGTKLPGKAIGRFITNISWTFGIGWLTWVVMGPVLRWSIAAPYEAEMRRRLRPRDFTKAEAEDLYEFGLKRLEEIKDYYVNMGYSDDKIEALLHILKKKIIREEARRYATDVANNYVEGYASREDLYNALSFAYYTDEEVLFRLYEEEQRRTNKLYDLRKKEVERAFKMGKIDEDEALSRLSEFIKDPEHRERLIALWKQYLKPEEEVEPNERLIARKKRLEVRIKGLNAQIAFLQEYLRERLELYDVMIKELENRYTIRMQRLEEQYDIRIAAIQEEFAKWREKRLEEIEARLRNLEAELSRYITLNLKEYTELLAKISDQTLLQMGTDKEVLLNMFLEGRFEELYQIFSQMFSVATVEEWETIDRILKILDRYLDLLGRYETLKAISVVRIEMREERVNTIIARLQAEKFTRLNQLKAELAHRKELLEKRKKIEETRIRMRIARLQGKVEELSVELSSINKQLQAVAS